MKRFLFIDGLMLLFIAITMRIALAKRQPKPVRDKSKQNNKQKKIRLPAASQAIQWLDQV